MSTKVSHSGVSPTRLWWRAAAVIFWQLSFYLQSTIKSMWFLTLCCLRHYQGATFHVGEWRRCKRMEARHQVGWDCSCITSHSSCLFSPISFHIWNLNSKNYFHKEYLVLVFLCVGKFSWEAKLHFKIFFLCIKQM